MEKVPVQIKASYLSHLQVREARLSDPFQTRPARWKRQNFLREQLLGGLPAGEWWDSYHSSDKQHEKKDQLQVFQGSSQHWCSLTLQKALKEEKGILKSLGKQPVPLQPCAFLLKTGAGRKIFFSPSSPQEQDLYHLFFLPFVCSTSEVLFPVVLGAKENGN